MIPLPSANLYLSKTSTTTPANGNIIKMYVHYNPEILHSILSKPSYQKYPKPKNLNH